MTVPVNDQLRIRAAYRRRHHGEVETARQAQTKDRTMARETRRSVRWITRIVAAFLLVFGLFCLNYTKADSVEHHTEFALSHNLPLPSRTILYGGVLCVVLGSGAIGYEIGSGRRA
jgi:hypothetical protein